MKEPARQSSVWLLWEPFRDRVLELNKRLSERGFDPMVFESLRTLERQKWLYGVGRTHSLTRKPVTWTLISRHLVGKGVDIISKSRLWNHPAFFKALREEAEKLGLRVLDKEQCHVEWTGKPAKD